MNINNNIFVTMIIIVALILLIGLVNEISAIAPPHSIGREDLARTAVPLGISGTYTTPSRLTSGYARIGVQVFSDVDAATDGVVVQQSGDVACDTAPLTANWDLESTFDYSGNSKAGGYIVDLVGRCVRVKYTNGGTGQTTFRLYAGLRAY